MLAVLEDGTGVTGGSRLTPTSRILFSPADTPFRLLSSARCAGFDAKRSADIASSEERERVAAKGSARASRHCANPRRVHPADTFDRSRVTPSLIPRLGRIRSKDGEGGIRTPGPTRGHTISSRAVSTGLTHLSALGRIPVVAHALLPHTPPPAPQSGDCREGSIPHPTPSPGHRPSVHDSQTRHTVRGHAPSRQRTSDTVPPSHRPWCPEDDSCPHVVPRLSVRGSRRVPLGH